MFLSLILIMIYHSTLLSFLRTEVNLKKNYNIDFYDNENDAIVKLFVHTFMKIDLMLMMIIFTLCLMIVTSLYMFFKDLFKRCIAAKICSLFN